MTLKNDTSKIKKFFTDSALVSFKVLYPKIDENRNEEYTFIKTDTTIFDDGTKYLDVYYLMGKNIHRIECMYVRSNDNSIKINSLFFNNLTKECNEYFQTIYKPSRMALQSTGITWRIVDNRIKEFAINLHNADIQNDYANLKLRLEVYRNEERIINRTIIVHDTIYSGDDYSFSANELKGLYINPLLTSNNVSYNIELISSSPPKEPNCEELFEIEKYLKEKKTN